MSQPTLILLLLSFGAALSSCSTVTKRYVDRECMDNLKILAGQQEKLEKMQGLESRGGGLTPAQVTAAIESVSDKVKTCSEHLFPNERDGGQIVFQFLIAETGKQAKACIAESHYENPEFNLCVLRAIRAAKFPRPANGAWTTVKHPLKF